MHDDDTGEEMTPRERADEVRAAADRAVIARTLEIAELIEAGALTQAEASAALERARTVRIERRGGVAVQVRYGG